MTIAYNSKFKADDLVGSFISSIYVSYDEEDLVIETLEGFWSLTTDADCCSETWWADLVGVKQILGHEITKAEVIEFPDDYEFDESRNRQEVDSIYGFRITTKNGSCDMIFRNSSNGYYGGDCRIDKVTDIPVAGFNRITEDWSA